MKRPIAAYHVRARDCAKMQRPFVFRNELYRQRTRRVREKRATLPVARRSVWSTFVSVSTVAERGHDCSSSRMAAATNSVKRQELEADGESSHTAPVRSDARGLGAAGPDGITSDG